jgi:hypothetical protein
MVKQEKNISIRCVEQKNKKSGSIAEIQAAKGTLRRRMTDTKSK